MRLKKQVDRIRDAEKADEASIRLDGKIMTGKGILKPGTAGTLSGMRNTGIGMDNRLNS